jgi:hypothetical protein
VDCFLVEGCTTSETMHVIVPEINKEHHVQIKNTCYSYIYLICIIYYLNKYNLKFLATYSVVQGVQENMVVNNIVQILKLLTVQLSLASCHS